jgi:hypothetical protein
MTGKQAAFRPRRGIFYNAIVSGHGGAHAKNPREELHAG